MSSLIVQWNGKSVKSSCSHNVSAPKNFKFFGNKFPEKRPLLSFTPDFSNAILEIEEKYEETIKYIKIGSKNLYLLV